MPTLTPTPGLPLDLTPEQRRTQIVVLLSRAVLRRVHLLRRSLANDAPEVSAVLPGDTLAGDRRPPARGT